MKRKVFSVLIALVLVVSFSLVTAAPVAASPGTLNVYPFTLSAGTNAAAWSTVQKATGSSSVKLNYVSGDNSSYVEFTPATGTTVNDLASITSTQWSFWYYASAANGPLLELRFTSADNTDPGGAGHVDITVDTAESSPAIDTGTTEAVTTASTCIYFGNDPTDGTSFYDNTGSVTLAGVLAAINAEAEMTAGTDTATAWELTRVRVEIGWDGSARNCYIDDIEIAGVTYYGKIQDAIDTASASDTISVAAGTYESGTLHVHTTENLTIESVSGANTTIISGAAGTDKLFEIGGHTGNTADNFTLDGFTLTGTYNYGVYLYVRGFDIKNNIITNPVSDGIFVTNPTTGPPTAINSGTINNNTITGKGASAMLYRPGILLEANDAVGAEISDIIISNNTVSGFGTTTVGVEAAGIRVASVTGCGVADNITITGNTLTGNYIGLHVYGASIGLEISSNTMSANNAGVAVCNSGSVNVSSTFNLDSNTITNNTAYGVHIIQTASEGLSGAKIIEYNNITGNGVGIENDFAAGTAPVAENNWWGNASGPVPVTLPATGYNSYGDTVNDASNVDYEPWLLAVVVSGTTPTTYDKTLALKDEWTLVSPDKEVTTGTAWVGTTVLSGTDTILAYKYTPGTGYPQVTAATLLTSVDAYYIKTDGGGGVGINYSTSSPGVVTKTLSAGWNVISCAGETDAYTLLSPLRYAQIGEQEGTGLTSLVGQASYNQYLATTFSKTLITDNEWLAITPTYTQVTLNAFDGYWVYMNAGKSFGVIPD